jgi:activator of HSP90 ATPase
MPPANSVANEGSAWNHAGTFEERNYTKWAHDKLSELLVALKVKEGNLSASIQTPEKITGDASICVVRGKKRYLYDFEFKLPFEITIDGKEKTFKGSYQMMDISNDEDYEVKRIN